MLLAAAAVHRWGARVLRAVPGGVRALGVASNLAITWFWGGAELLESTIEHYGGALDAGAVDRAEHLGRLMVVGQVSYGLRAGRPDHLDLEDGLAALARSTT